MNYSLVPGIRQGGFFLFLFGILVPPQNKPGIIGRISITPLNMLSVLLGLNALSPVSKITLKISVPTVAIKTR